MRRISEETLKRNGFERINAMQCYQKNGVIVSYGLIVAINNTSASGYHDYSATTTKQVGKATSTSVDYRRKNWNIVSDEEFQKLSQKFISSLR